MFSRASITLLIHWLCKNIGYSLLQDKCPLAPKDGAAQREKSRINSEKHRNIPKVQTCSGRQLGPIKHHSKHHSGTT